MTTIAVGNLEINKSRENNDGAYKGYVPNEGIWKKEIDSLAIKNSYSIDVNKRIIFEEFISLTKRYKVPLTVVYSPVYYWYDKSYSIEICREICKENDVPFFDYSKNSEFLDHQDYFMDIFHLNGAGARIFTKNVVAKVNLWQTY